MDAARLLIGFLLLLAGLAVATLGPRTGRGPPWPFALGGAVLVAAGAALLIGLV